MGFGVQGLGVRVWGLGAGPPCKELELSDYTNGFHTLQARMMSSLNPKAPTYNITVRMCERNSIAFRSSDNLGPVPEQGPGYPGFEG